MRNPVALWPYGEPTWLADQTLSSTHPTQLQQQFRSPCDTKSVCRPQPELGLPAARTKYENPSMAKQIIAIYSSATHPKQSIANQIIATQREYIANQCK